MIKFILYASNYPSLFKQIQALPPTVKHVVTVKEYKSQRSLEQNRWVRGFARDLGNHLGYEEREMYDILMYEHNPVYIFRKDTGEVIRLAGHFSDLKTDEAAEVQDKIQRWAANMGFFWE